MKNIKIKHLIGIITIAIIIILTVILLYKNIKPSVTDRDISVEGVLELNNSGVNMHYEYIINIIMNKSKSSKIIVYPYIGYTTNFATSGIDEVGYYRPNNFQTGGGNTELIAINELKSKNIIETGKDVSLTGFWFPNEAGQYKARIYLDKLDSFKEVKNPVLLYVFTEKKYGKELTWAMIVPVIVK